MVASLSVQSKQPTLSISIVLFQQHQALLNDTLNSLAEAVNSAVNIHSAQLFLIDNNPAPVFAVEPDHPVFSEIITLQGHGNIGYGRGHNLAIMDSQCDYHLVLNPDVILAFDAVYCAVNFMQQYSQAGVLAPSVKQANGNPEYLCKRYPAVLDLILRGFAPVLLKRLFRKRLAHYEMRDLIKCNPISCDPVWDVPLLSGCFMFFRGKLIRDLGGFDPAYFLYFEDYDLSIRLAKYARTVYVPEVKITHFGGYAARKGWHHIKMFMRSAVRFYHIHGWRLW